jgi:isopenicillin N synthase-like dioxygenase
MAYAQAQQIDHAAIPVIDITPLRDGSDAVTVAKALHTASQGMGFIYIKGHGIQDETIKAAYDSALKFFHHSTAEKSKVTVSTKHRGWLRQGGAVMADGVNADLKESFIWGGEDANGNTVEDHPLRGKNLWPAFVPELQRHAIDYFHQAQEVAFHLMRGFALGLNLEEEYFLRSNMAPLSRASFVYYPSQSENLGTRQFGAGPHTDFGVLTVLCQDTVGGLQIEDVDGKWIEAPPIEGSLVINVGDLLSRWTDGVYRSTKHRVINSSSRERLSLVLAYDPDPDTIIDARNIFGPGHKAAQEPITCGDYLIWRFEKAFSYREAKKQ